MSAAVAMTPSPAPHDRSSYMDRTTVPQSASYSDPRQSNKNLKPSSKTSSSKTSPKSSRKESISSVIVKKEPTSSPDIRHRPQKLDLSASNNSSKPSNDATNPIPHTVSRPLAGPLTARMDGLGIQEVGLACISPGFNTQDPTKRDHLQRSMSVREQQRTLIESRMNKQSVTESNTAMESTKDREAGSGNLSQGPTSLKKKAPPGLSIVAPSHEEFAQERIIQSAPLNQSFTSRYHPQPLTRHIINQPSNLSNTSHIHHVNANSHARSPIQSISATSANTTIHHVPAIQTSSRLPPIMDIFAGESLALRQSIGQGNSNPHASSSASNNSSQSNGRPAFPSPGYSATQSGRSREYRSAEDAQADLSGGRPELLPKIVHYGGHQPPPTPPSPRTSKSIRLNDLNHSGGSRRRTRMEYEDGDSPPLGNGPNTGRRNGPFSEGRNSPTNSQKKEQFIRLCADAWDLFHS
ncbi:hypothetical protein OnM2_076016 [Erysiphe neolycopersici]|uniref:Uncharacterized protein n=1 Tax=Erysiphe neolycopersici TaxID=212602 RepID=A0A420HI81_9PEZI|nr:hypothetical protein OnM2_076016 [Erysiphe neolycopersici]